ncbi:MAG: BolA/IbaG family iron-sulfur metabolism protein [Solirubrobacterales bacterium]|nr:BolA/IbaG family iron-sulfur metabolism protein [Solirubrobacterales bacterium]
MSFGDLPVLNDPTPGELTERIEDAIPGSRVVEADGDGHHFRVKVVSEAFEGLSRIDRHRLINKIFEGELGGRIHALSIGCQTPEEEQ